MSQAIGKPVKLMCTRNDDMRHGRVRPRSHHQLRAVHAAGDVLLMAPHVVRGAGSGSGTGQALVDAATHPTIGTAFFALSQACPYNSGPSPKASRGLLRQPTATWRSVYSAQLGRLRKSSSTRLRRRWEPTRSPCAGSSSKPPTLAPCSTSRHQGKWGRAMSSGPLKGWLCMASTARSRLPRRDQLQRRKAAGHQSRDGPGRRRQVNQRSSCPGHGQPHGWDQHCAAGRQPPR